METHPLLTVAQGCKRAQLRSGKGWIHQEWILHELALPRKLLTLG